MTAFTYTAETRHLIVRALESAEFALADEIRSTFNFRDTARLERFNAALKDTRRALHAIDTCETKAAS